MGNSKVDNLMPILDNSTRWNSTYQSLKRALLLRDRIFLFCQEFQSDLEADHLSENDWNHLTAVYQGLKPFYQATLRIEGKATGGHHGAIWEALPLLKALLSVTEDGQHYEEVNGRGL